VTEVISSPDLRRRLREAAEEELAELLEEHADELDQRAIGQVFRNPFLQGSQIERLLALPQLRSSYEARREAVLHPRTPRPLALQLATGLFWRDLARVGIDTRLHPMVRRTADRRLIERLPGLAVGEKVAIGRSSSAAVLEKLRFDPTPRVIAAMLENPRLTEGLLLPLASFERASPQVLAVLARDRRWGARTPLRKALCLNPATPVAASLTLLPSLDKVSLAAVSAAPRLPAAVRRRAALLAGAAAPPGGR